MRSWVSFFFSLELQSNAIGITKAGGWMQPLEICGQHQIAGYCHMLQDRMAIQRGPRKAWANRYSATGTLQWHRLGSAQLGTALLREGRVLVSRRVKLGTAAWAANQLCTGAAACAPAQDDPGLLFIQHLLICIWVLCPVLCPTVHKGFENTKCAQRRVNKMVRHWVFPQRAGWGHRDSLENRRFRQSCNACKEPAEEMEPGCLLWYMAEKQ